MKMVYFTAILVDIEDGACPGCASVALQEKMESLFNDQLSTVIDGNNCARMGAIIQPLKMNVESFAIPRQDKNTVVH